MAYVPTVWVEDGPPGVSAANLNKLETGVKDAHDLIAAAGSGGAVVATTIAGLGTGSAGKQGLLRLGSSGSGYHFLPMVYDSSLAKWVSAERPVNTSVSPNLTTSISSGSMYPGYGVALTKWADHIAAGLHPQYRVYGMTVVGSTVSNWSVGYTFAHASLDNYPTSSPIDLTRIGTDICVSNPTVAGTPGSWIGGENGSQAWVECPIPGSPKALGGVVFFCQNAATTGGWAFTCYERWVG